MGSRAGLDGGGKCRAPTGIRSPDRPARSESLYRLSYPGRLSCFYTEEYYMVLVSSEYGDKQDCLSGQKSRYCYIQT